MQKNRIRFPRIQTKKGSKNVIQNQFRNKEYSTTCYSVFRNLEGGAKGCRYQDELLLMIRKGNGLVETAR